MTFGERAADKLAEFVGSWKFVIGQAVFLVAWFTINSITYLRGMWWDGYPFIFANLVMSIEAAFATPVVLMSQNRSSANDRKILHNDYLEDQETNRIAEAIARKLGVELDDQGD